MKVFKRQQDSTVITEDEINETGCVDERWTGLAQVIQYTFRLSFFLLSSDQSYVSGGESARCSLWMRLDRSAHTLPDVHQVNNISR
jgi:hypothetical protein